MLKKLSERIHDYDSNHFVNDLAAASRSLGILEAKINGYHFNSIILPVLHKKEAISSMYIEGTQTTMSDVFENEVSPKNSDDKIMLEISNHTHALTYGADYLRYDCFTHSFIQKLHEIMLKDISKGHEAELGRYKTADNRIVNSAGRVVFAPPSYTATKKYMDELIAYMNDATDDIHPLVKAAIIHSQFESIHPFSDGNGRVGRLLVSLYLYKSHTINFPFFYISEAISQDKTVYYSMLTNSRINSYDEWIKYFLKKIQIQTAKHIAYIDELNKLFLRTKATVQSKINSPKYDAIIECMFTQPVLTASYIEEKLSVSHGQAVRYLNVLEQEHVLLGDDKKRNRKFYFSGLLDLIQSM